MGMNGTTAPFWKINDRFAPLTSIRQNGTISELEVFCSEDLDMANITCVLSVVNGTSFIDISSDPALLRIQGVYACLHLLMDYQLLLQ